MSPASLQVRRRQLAEPRRVDHRAYLAAHPLGRRTVIACEWLHLPALELLLRAVSVVRPFRRHSFAGERSRVAGGVSLLTV